jgi:hypothetical protein
MLENSDQKQKKHLFQPGVSGNPAGKPKGAKNHATRAAQALIDGKAKEVVEKALELALAGDGPVLRAILDRLCPPRKDAPATVALPLMESAADLPAAMAAILAACAAGELTPSEAIALAGLVETHRKSLETSNLELRIAALEQKKGA